MTKILPEPVKKFIFLVAREEKRSLGSPVKRRKKKIINSKSIMKINLFLQNFFRVIPFSPFIVDVDLAL